MKLLIVGSGGREHALAWKLGQSPQVEAIFCAPGNAGTATLPKTTNLAVAPEDLPGLENAARTHRIDLTVVGPEAPLELGLVDRFTAAGFPIFGPSQRAARIETSKTFSKLLCRKHAIPTADFAVFHDPDSARRYIREHPAPIVIKAAGLAAGKGVLVCKTSEEALTAVHDIMERRVFGDAGREVVVEEFLTGEEASILFFTDGKAIYPLETAQDHKAIFDGDHGPNTGGMGAYSPAPVVTPELLRVIEREVLVPTVHALNAEGSAYRGVLYAGLMLTHRGPQVLEFNARFGDPETQPILMRLKSDLLPVILAILDGKLETISLDWDPRPAVCVVMSAGGYPGKYEKGKVISGLEAAATIPDSFVFHAGTTLGRDGSVLTNGGRVLGVTALGETIAEAQQRAYEVVRLISFEGAYYRTDIARKALARQGQLRF